MYRGGSAYLAFAAGGTELVSVRNAGGFVGTLFTGGPAYVSDGSAPAPSVTFINDVDTGFYRIAADRLGITAGGVHAGEFRNIAGAVSLFGLDGSVSQPYYSFNNDPDTGLYRVGADRLGFSAAGAAIVDFSTAFFSLTGSTNRMLVPDGSASLPSYTFNGDQNTGIYWIGSDQLGFSEGGAGFRIGFRSIPRSTTATTLVVGDVGKCVAISAAINIPASVFSAGDAVSIYNDSGGALNITISAGTLRLAGTASTGTRPLAARGVATLWFNVGGATPEVICSGNVT
jgi:hypothetical protein